MFSASLRALFRRAFRPCNTHEQSPMARREHSYVPISIACRVGSVWIGEGWVDYTSKRRSPCPTSVTRTSRQPEWPAYPGEQDHDFINWLNRRATEAINDMLVEVNEQEPTSSARHSRAGTKKRRPNPNIRQKNPQISHSPGLAEIKIFLCFVGPGCNLEIVMRGDAPHRGLEPAH